MKRKTPFLMVTMPLFAIATLGGCNATPRKSAPASQEPEESKPLEVGDTVRMWTSPDDGEKAPLGLAEGAGSVSFGDDGYDDYFSLSFTLKQEGYIGTDLVEKPYFKDEDAKNGDIISLYYYLPEGSNIKTIQLEAVPWNGRASTVLGEMVNVTSDIEGKWELMEMTYDSLDMLGSFRLNYTLADAAKDGKILLDDIEITYGEETVKTGYVSNNESLYETYEDYFKLGTCMSDTMVRNTEIRKITLDNFNSITAENEGKPERILDQAACQALLSKDPAGVAITTAPFERIYDWAEEHGIGVRHHTFVWYSQTPAWFFTTDYTQNGPKASRELMLERMENYIKTTIETLNERWPGLVYAIDVANEAVENGGLRTNNNNWYTTVGDDFVYYAFKYASEIKEELEMDVELYYNDFAFDYQPNLCRWALENILKDAIDEGLIDGVGLQTHLDSGANMDNIINDAKYVKQKGLKCQLTEIDITTNGTSQNEYDKQSNAYKTLIKKVLENNASKETDINAVVLWGITDNLSWKRNQYPLLFTENYEKKPAYTGFLSALSEANINE
ncbi:MAG: endo-1,4-beta-xylanase [Bacilli bacterium]|nr:endo-1,4-beta-xylanase [Bacilli bacterium]